MKTIKLISRKSDLAKIQAHLVSTELKHKFPDLEVELIFKSTLGDNDLTTPLNKMPDIGVFTSDIKKDLISGRGDLAVHSWKDLPVDTEPGTFICGTLQRADMRDMLFLKTSRRHNTDLEILSSSPRREKNLSYFLPNALPNELTDISFHDVRGNIQTRFTKLMNGKQDGLVVAKAAIDRILKSQTDEFKVGRELLREALKTLNWMVMPLSVNPCAAAQGALALEIRTEDTELRSMIESISDSSAFKLVEEERLILKSYGGGCHQKIGASVESFEIGQVKTVKGETEDGEEIDERVFEPKEEVKDFFEGVKNNSYFPKNTGEQIFFKREPVLESDSVLRNLKNTGVYISRSNALGNKISLDDSNCVWASGLGTWKTLAKRKVWVNGCSDSLGERNSPEENPFEDMNWLKLSHADNKDETKKILATYNLNPIDLDPKIKENTHFYWMSSTAFERAISVYPEILKAKHATGLGKTYEKIQSLAPNKVMPFLNYEDWLTQIEKHS